MKIRRPVVNYHGSKFRIAPRIIELFPAHSVYVEPFGGGAGVLMRKPRDMSSGEVYNDIGGDVVNVFRVLRDPLKAEQLRRSLALTPWARDEYELAYQPCEDLVERARRLIARSFMAYGTSWQKGNRSGFRARAFQQRSPAPIQWARYPDEIPAFVERLQGVAIENRDALDVIRHQDTPGTLFFCDPPYPVHTRSALRSLSDRERAYEHDLSDEEHRDLAGVLHQIKGMAVVCGYACALYDEEFYPDWERLTLKTMADGGRPRTEVLWINPAATIARRQMREAAE